MWLPLFLCLGRSAPAAPARITIGFNPAEKTEKVEANGKRLSDYLKRKTGLGVRSYVAPDYEALLEALRSGKVDFAFLPPFSFVKAEENGARLLLKAVRKGQSVYYSALITRKAAGIETVAGLKGKRLGWVDRGSATGYLIPRAEIRKLLSEDPDRFLGEQRFFGTHDALVRAVTDGAVDAGATWANDPEGRDGAWQLYLSKPEERKGIRVLFLSRPIPGDALVVRSRLQRTDPSTVETVIRALQRMGEATDGQQILNDLYGIDKMVPAASRDFDPVREAARSSRSPRR